MKVKVKDVKIRKPVRVKSHTLSWPDCAIVAGSYPTRRPVQTNRNSGGRIPIDKHEGVAP